MILWPINKQNRKRVQSPDWTGGNISKSTRHYLIGDFCEMKELFDYLSFVSPHIRDLVSTNSMGKEEDKTKKASASSKKTSKKQKIEKKENHASENKVPSPINSLCDLPLPSLHPRSTIRLTRPDPEIASANESSTISSSIQKRKIDSVQGVHDFLRRCGIKKPEEVNPCLKAGILNGNIKVPEDLVQAENASSFLNTVIHKAGCLDCGKEIKCTVKMVLDQITYAGLD